MQFHSLMNKLFEKALRSQQFLQTLLGHSSQSKAMLRPAHSSALLTPSGHKPGTANQPQEEEKNMQAKKNPNPKIPKTIYITEVLQLQSLASYLNSGKQIIQPDWQCFCTGKQVFRLLKSCVELPLMSVHLAKLTLIQ